jgi:hypothetical protein
MYYYGEDSGIAQQINDQFAPRAGFIYQPGELGSQKFSGSYGRFYEQLPTFVLTVGRFPLECDFFIWDTDPRVPEADSLFELPFCLGSPEVDDLKGQHYDEFLLGYERSIGENWKVGVNGSHRVLREAIQDGFDSDGASAFGNPGRDNLDNYPDAVRRYTALELTLGRSLGGRSQVHTSYVLSRSFGNYVGVFDGDTGVRNAHGGLAWNAHQTLVNAKGLLPNDRTHVFKLYGAHAFDFGLTAGGFFTAQSGTPLSEFGTYPAGGGRVHLRERGTFGRSPWLWDLNLRFAYDLGKWTGFGERSTQRLLLDVLHAFGQREAVNIDQLRFLASSAAPGSSYEEVVANQIGPNPNYLKANAFQPPMTIRLGIETTF